jgi:molybdopterin-guanine dinucleotide biosynthesis protein A
LTADDLTGAVLAGGEGSRMGGDKPGAPLAGRPLISYPLAALVEACPRVAVVCKRGTALPPLQAGVERWDEPDQPRHPAAGVAHALERAGDAVLVCAADMPFVSAEECRRLTAAAAAAPAVAAVVAEAAGWLQPTFAVYRAAALPALRACGTAPLLRAVERLEPALVALPPHAMRSVDTPEALAAAERELAP